MAEIVLLIFKEFCPHVVILADIFFIGAGLPLFMILKFDITGNPVLLQIQEILLAAVSAVCRHFLQPVTKDLDFKAVQKLFGTCFRTSSSVLAAQITAVHRNYGSAQII